MGSTLIASPSCTFSILWSPCAAAPLADNKTAIPTARTGVTRLLKPSMLQQRPVRSERGVFEVAGCFETGRGAGGSTKGEVASGDVGGRG